MTWRASLCLFSFVFFTGHYLFTTQYWQPHAATEEVMDQEQCIGSLSWTAFIATS